MAKSSSLINSSTLRGPQQIVVATADRQLRAGQLEAAAASCAGAVRRVGTAGTPRLASRAVYFFSVIGKLVDLGGQDEIVLRQPADGVRVQFDPHVAIALQVQVGMMAFVFGDLGDALEEIDAGHEVLHDPILANALAVVRQSPAVELRQLPLSFFERVLGHAPFARHALLLSQLFGGLRFHGSLLGINGRREWGDRGA